MIGISDITIYAIIPLVIHAESYRKIVDRYSLFRRILTLLYSSPVVI